MIYEVIWRSVALREFVEAIQWYENERVGLGAQLAEEVRQLVHLIAANPAHFPRVHPPTRRALLRHFPYNLFFYERGKQVVILSLHHAKRDPVAWKSRQE